MVHGVLHYCGYKDKAEEDEKRERWWVAYDMSKKPVGFRSKY